MAANDTSSDTPDSTNPLGSAVACTALPQRGSCTSPWASCRAAASGQPRQWHRPRGCRPAQLCMCGSSTEHTQPGRSTLCRFGDGTMLPRVLRRGTQQRSLPATVRLSAAVSAKHAMFACGMRHWRTARAPASASVTDSDIVFRFSCNSLVHSAAGSTPEPGGLANEQPQLIQDVDWSSDLANTITLIGNMGCVSATACCLTA